MPSPPETTGRRRRRLSTRGRILLAVVLAALAILFMSLRGIARFYTDYLWFDSLDAGSVWRGVLGAKAALAIIFTGVFFALLWLNLLIADRLAPRFRPSGPEEELLERYYDLVGRRGGLVRFVAAAVFALIAGVGVSQQWRSWLLFTNRVDFDMKDPVHGIDIGFYVFQLPFLRFVVSWLFAAFVIILIVTLVAHYLNGGIRVQTPAQRVTAAVKGHLSVLLGVLAIIKAADYWLQRFALTVSRRGFVEGASFSDVRARLPALNLLIAISILSVALFLFNIKRRGWTLPVVAVGLWAFAAIVVGSAYPWFVQRFQVEARGESAKEEPYIERNIAATKFAYGIDHVQEQDFAAAADLQSADLAAAADLGVFRNVGLLDPSIVSEAVRRRQSQNGWLSVSDRLDTDHYEIGGRDTLTVIGARELNLNGVPQQSWEGRHLIYTQGYGAVLAAAGQVVGGEASYLVRGVGDDLAIDPSAAGVSLDQPRLYFSEHMSGYAIVNNKRPEIAYENDDFSYSGNGGVALSSIVRRAAFALRFGDLDPLVSEFVTSTSRMIHIRDVRERVQTIAPFLSFDSDPYPVLAEGRIVYVIDGYTTTDAFPYSQSFGGETMPDGSGLRHSFNYVRNSVKATVDAYDGTVNLYLVSNADGEVEPIARAYQRAFPELFKPLAEMPASLQAHLRHPEDMFRVQTTMYALYHVDDATSFYNQEGRWAVADQPDTTVMLNTAPTAPTTTLVAPASITLSGSTSGKRVDPQYQMLQLPGDGGLSFVATRPFVPTSTRLAQRRETLTAFMAARTDGTLVAYRVTTPEVLSPTLLTSRIMSEDSITRTMTYLSNPETGSSVELGARVMVPIKDSLLWITPLYVTASAGAVSSVPVLNSVIVSYGQRVVAAPTLNGALTALFGNDVEFKTLNVSSAPLIEPVDPNVIPPPETTTTTSPTGTTAPPDSSVTTVPPPTTSPPPGATLPVVTDQAALAEANRLLEAAQQALLAGNLGEYQNLVQQAQAIITTQIERGAAPATTQVGSA